MKELSLRDELKNQGYNLRERANIYSGIVLGALAPIVVFRYMIPTPSETSIGKEVLAWGISIGANVGASILTHGFPLLYSTVMGTALGSVNARYLRQERHDKERRDYVERQKSLEDRAVGGN